MPDLGIGSGLPQIEGLCNIFKEKNIKVKKANYSAKKANKVALKASQTFLRVSDVYAPFSGLFTYFENIGVANIPDYLGESLNSVKSLNDVGMHPKTLLEITEGKTHLPIEDIEKRIVSFLVKVSRDKEKKYKTICDMISSFYNEDIIARENVSHIIQ